MGGRPIEAHEMRSYYSERSYVSSATNATQVFKEREMWEKFDPSKMKLPREARDSVASPHSRGIILSEDITGSLGSFLLSLIKNEFPRLITQIYDSVPYDPHIMFMGIGDVAEGDKAPLQVTQFETDLKMLEQLEKIYLEQGGGSNSYESYILSWYFAAKHIKMDCWEKRKEKGFLFTFGDEEPTPRLTDWDIKKVFGSQDELVGRVITAEDCFEAVSEKFYCYHIILHGNGYDSDVVRKWRNLMGSKVCDLSDHSFIPELVTTILRMHEGLNKSDALNRIQNSKAKSIVESALRWHEENIISPIDSIEHNIEVF